mmetsp:Transcript_11954/g.18835  ORF Transcript_11954/g.18835 Transcript_11954/m.18835 type:complete len:426 (+) Transcript_11954:165-1442(+)
MEDSDALRRQSVLRRLYIASALCATFIIVEVTGGLIANSLAILSDAAHLFADLASFAVAIAASYLASLPATHDHTFGLKRSESLAALFSMVSLAFVSIWLAYEAIRRINEPPEEGVDGAVMSGIALIGVVVNIILAIVLGEDHVHMPGAHDHSHDHDGHCSGDDSHDNHDDHSHSHGHSSAHDHHADDSHDHHASSHDHSSSHDHGTSHDHQCNNHSNTNGHDHEHGHSETDELLKTTKSPHTHTKMENFEAIEAQHDSEVSAAEDKRNVNLRAAYLHVMADLAQSTAVLIAGIVIWFKPEWHIIDPICTLLFCIIVFYSTIGVFKSALSVLLEATPPQVDWKTVYGAIKDIPNVSQVHDLHIWSISHGMPSLSVHCTSSDPDALRKIGALVRGYGIMHSTIQVQTQEGPCVTCDEGCCMPSLLD